MAMASSEDGSETEKDEVTEELESDEVDPELAEQDFSADDAPEEAKVKRMPNPADPTAEERERQYPTHLPYTPWCKICVQTKAREDPHYKQVNTELQSRMPEIAMDCNSLTQTKDETDRLGLLVCKDRWTQTFFCCQNQRKGAQDAHIVDNVVKVIESMGHTKTTLVTGGEPAIVRLQAKI